MLVMPQGSILCPILFLICIIDLSENLPCNSRLFVNDMCLFPTVQAHQEQLIS